MREWWRRLRFGAQREDGLSEEIRFHLDRQAEKLMAAGLEPDEARRQARLKFGAVEAIKDDARDEFRPALLEDFWRDVRFGARLLARTKGFTFVAVATLGLGIGAATSVFTVVDGVLLRPLPYPGADRIVRILQVNREGRPTNSVSEPNFVDWKEQSRSFSAMAETQAGPMPVAFGSEAVLIPGAAVSREFFDVMGVAPAVGRGFAPDEQRTGGAAAAIISDTLWRTRFDAAPPGSLTLRTGGVAYQVVGVMPPSFDYPVGTQFWTPRERNPPQTSRTAHNFQAIGRVRGDVAVRAAHDEISAISKALKAQHGDGTWMFDGAVIPLRDHLTTASRPVLLILFGAALLLLAIACLNVSNLYLARAATRHRELALRLAIGASRWRIVRQLLAESLVLAIAAGALGAGLAFAGVRALVALQPPNLPRMAGVAIDAGVLAFALGVALVTALLLGLVTAARTSPTRLREWLNEGQRTLAGGRGERTRQALVVAQVAATIVLLVGAGLLARSFIRVLAVNPGYTTSNTLIVDLAAPFPADAEARRRRMDAQRDTLAAIERLPGVEAAGAINAFPLGGGGNYANGRFLEMTRPDEIASMADIARLQDQVQARGGMADYRVASAGYFTTMRIPLISGRLFEESDGPDAPHVAVISESLAKTKWPGQDPIGRFVQFGNMDGDLRGFRIVGVVGDVREISPEALPGATFYAHYRQRMTPRVSIAARTAAPSALAAAARRLAMEMNPEVPVQIRTIEDALDRAIAGRRFSLVLIAVFSVCALVLATLGVYGLMAYLVAQRTREIGIRLALGAESRDVLRLVLGRGLRLAVAGVVVGLVASLWLTGLLDGMLFGVTRTDPVAFAGVLIVTLAAVLAASYVPANRAMKVAPVEALRGD